MSKEEDSPNGFWRGILRVFEPGAASDRRDPRAGETDMAKVAGDLNKVLGDLNSVVKRARPER